MPRPAKEPDPKTFAGQVAARVRELRLKRRMSVEEAAQRAGIPVPSWYHCESGRHLSLERLPQLAKGLGCKVRTLIPSDA